MTTRDQSPLVVVAPPRKSRYNRKMAQPVRSEEAACEAAERYASEAPTRKRAAGS